MPVALSYPGVYIEEVASGVRTITGVATSITAFVGRALRGPVNDPQPVFSFAEFERVFGELWSESKLGFAVNQYFQNGGGQALIVRVHKNALTAAATLPTGANPGDPVLNLAASSPGAWGGKLTVAVEQVPPVAPALVSTLFNLTITDTISGAKEVFFNLSPGPSDSRFVTQVLAQGSALVRVTGPVPTALPLKTPAGMPIAFAVGASADGAAPTAAEVVSGGSLAANKEGIYALEKTDLFNLLCLPPYAGEVQAADLANAYQYCNDRRAILLVDPPSTVTSVANAKTFMASLTSSKNAAFYFPRLMAANPLNENRLEAFAPSGAVAGVLARTDAARGVWKSAAGIDATINGALALETKLTDGENGLLNPLGINCLRDFPVYGRVVWGSRTLQGADQQASDWKYLAVRRMALFLEESLYRGTQWVVFEPNDEPLWAQIRLNVGAFMQNLFRQGAFQGTSPKDAYFVRCDRTTTTQTDINLGIVNILVGFAPLKPAEFVVIRLQQIAGDIPT